MPLPIFSELLTVEVKHKTRVAAADACEGKKCAISISISTSYWC